MSLDNIASRLVRCLYVLVMYTGLRALANRARSLLLPAPRVSEMDGALIPSARSGPLRVRVHGRAAPRRVRAAQAAGMISVSLIRPGIPRGLYWLLRLSSHFGCGHVELAFYEDGTRVCVYAVRNMLRSNLARLGCGARFGGLGLATEHEETLVLRRVMDELRSREFDVQLASPEECVALAVSPWLMNPRTRDRSLMALTRRYRRLARLAANA